MVLDTLTITFELSQASRDKCAREFKKVHYYPKREEAPPPEVVRETDIWFSNWLGLPDDVERGDLGRTRIVQLTSGEYESGGVTALLGKEGRQMEMGEGRHMFDEGGNTRQPDLV